MDASSGINKDTGKMNRFLSPQRVTITVPAMTLKKLLKRSLVEGRSVSNLAAFLLEQALEGDSQDYQYCFARLWLLLLSLSGSR